MEEKFKIKRILFIILLAIGVGMIFGSFGFLAVREGFDATAIMMFFGFMIFLSSLAGYTLNRRDYREYLGSIPQGEPTSRAEMRLSNLEIKRLVEGADVIDLEQFEKEQGNDYDFKYILVQQILKKIFCVISKTQIEKDKTALQCPNCQNYYLSKYLLGWLNKNYKCPICQFELKIKKI